MTDKKGYRSKVKVPSGAPGGRDSESFGVGFQVSGKGRSKHHRAGFGCCCGLTGLQPRTAWDK